MKQSLRWLAVGAAGLGLVAGSMATAANATGPNDEGALGSDSTTPFAGFTSGADGGTRVIISDHGNIIEFESPAGYEHLGAVYKSEGYVLCYDPPAGPSVHAYDGGQDEAGFGAPTVLSASPTSAVVVRETTDGVLRLRQQFTFRGVEKRVFIQNTIKNLTTGTVSDIVFRRVAEFDIDRGGSSGWTSTPNHFSRTSIDSVNAWNTPEEAAAGGAFDAHSLMLRALRGGQARGTTAAVLDTTEYVACDAPSDPTPFYNDGYGSIDFKLGGLPPGQAKSVKVDYVRG